MAIQTLHQLDDNAAIVLSQTDLEQPVVEVAPPDASLSGPRWGRRPQDADAAMEATLTTHADALATLADAGVLSGQESS